MGSCRLGSLDQDLNLGFESRDSFCFTWEKKKEGKEPAGTSCVEQAHLGSGAWVWDFVPVLLTLGELSKSRTPSVLVLLRFGLGLQI